jgi:hypothetical protein
MVKNDGFIPFFDQTLVQDIEHFQKGHISFDSIDGIFHQLPFGAAVFLSPYFQE